MFLGDEAKEVFLDPNFLLIELAVLYVVYTILSYYEFQIVYISLIDCLSTCKSFNT